MGLVTGATAIGPRQMKPWQLKQLQLRLWQFNRGSKAADPRRHKELGRVW